MLWGQNDWHWAVSRQQRLLRWLITQAQHTAFGRTYRFAQLATIADPHALYEEFATTVPIHTYEDIFKQWWVQWLEGKRDVTWPGQPLVFALSSGTTTGSTKYIPVTRAMRNAFRRVNLSIFQSVLLNYRFPRPFYLAKVLVLGGRPPSSTGKQTGIPGADLSGMMAVDIPLWFRRWILPPASIRRKENWEDRLQAILDNAHQWNVGTIIGLPQWTLLLFEQLCARYGCQTIHDLWPHFHLFVFGGLPLRTYQKEWERWLGHPVHLLETYLASEGYLAYQDQPKVPGLRLALNAGVFFEFVPFRPPHVQDGRVQPGATAYPLWKVPEDRSELYVPVLSTCAGAWRYVLGDVIRFVPDRVPRIQWAGRLRFFLNACGEHVSLENLEEVIVALQERFARQITEYTVIPLRRSHPMAFRHLWCLGVVPLSAMQGSDGSTSTGPELNAQSLAQEIDRLLQKKNDDYATMRTHMLDHPQVMLLPVHLFYQWMERQGKAGGQHKFPRILRGQQALQWLTFLDEHGQNMTSGIEESGWQLFPDQ